MGSPLFDSEIEKKKNGIMHHSICWSASHVSIDLTTINNMHQSEDRSMFPTTYDAENLKQEINATSVLCPLPAASHPITFPFVHRDSPLII